MHKLVIQIPCLNEAETLPATLADLPRVVEGFDVVEWLVIDDGSTDDTVAVARAHGVDHVVSLRHNQGLARAFMIGLDYALKQGADVVLNTDADNQYSAKNIPDLVKPILEKRALIVIGERPIMGIEHFSPLKKVLQRLGSFVVQQLSGTRVADAPSGFRAMHRDAAIQLNVFNNYTYTLETIIQAGRRNIPVVSVPVQVNGYLRPSRLISSIPRYISRSIVTMIRIFIVYRPVQLFLSLAFMTFLPAAIVTGRWLYYYATGRGGGHVQSLILAGALFTITALLAVAGVLADLLATNRMLMEDVRVRLRRMELPAPVVSSPAPASPVRRRATVK